MAKSFHEPPISIAIAVKWWVLESSVYLAVLFEDARSAAAASLVAVSSMYELAYVSATVMNYYYHYCYNYYYFYYYYYYYYYYYKCTVTMQHFIQNSTCFFVTRSSDTIVVLPVYRPS